MLAKDDKSSYAHAILVLKSRFRSVEIEELKGLEFHRRMQTDESIERLGMDLQKLGRKAFPSTEGRDFDRLLKGRFYQALHPRWQRKLNAPRADESFAQLYERARMLEQHDKQFTASAAHRSEPLARRNRPPVSGTQPAPAPVTTRAHGATPRQGANVVRLCHSCHQPGHFARNCPVRSRERRPEAQGRAHVTVSHLEAVDGQPKEFTEEELERMLSQCRLRKEKQMLEETIPMSDGAVANIEAASPVGRATGPLLYKDVMIEGVPVVAMVDCGSQTTISRSLLHTIARKLQEGGKPLPELKLPSVHLYGKDGPSGRSQLPISAEVELHIEASGETVTVPMFVQPNSV